MPSTAKSRVLYLSYDGMTDALGQSQVIPYLEGLAKEGHSITLLSFEKAERFEKFSTEISKRLLAAGIEWVPLSYTKKPPVLSTLWDIWKMRRKVFALHHAKHFHIVHCRSYITSLIGLAMKEKFGVKFLFDMRGFYADERVDGGLWKLSNPLYRMIYNYFKSKEKQFLARADYIVSLTHAGKQEILSWKEISNQPLPIEVIPCCSDLERFSASAIDISKVRELRVSLKIEDDEFVLSYLGSIGTWYLPDEMLDFFACLLKYKPKSRFLFITNEPAEMIFAKAGQKNIPAGKITVTSAPYALVPQYLALSSATIFFIKAVFSKKASSPTKQGEIMGLGLTQVCNAGVGDVDEIVDDNSGVLVKSLSAEDYELAVNRLLNGQFDKGRIRAKAEEVYSLKKGIEKYRRIYERLLQAENPTSQQNR